VYIKFKILKIIHALKYTLKTRTQTTNLWSLLVTYSVYVANHNPIKVALNIPVLQTISHCIYPS